MKVSYTWLAHHFHTHGRSAPEGSHVELPTPEEIARLLTKHAYEVESVTRVGEDHVFDIDVLPNRAHDSLSHRGVARELSRILGLPTYPESLSVPAPQAAALPRIRLEEGSGARRYMAAIIEGVRIEPSPAWLKARLESVGLRSINNVVDVTNFVMMELGQPIHAFDLDKVAKGEDGNPEVAVRLAAPGETIALLEKGELALTGDEVVIADSERPLALAGVKGGSYAAITPETASVLIESANFDPKRVRTVARRLSLRTDSSARFEQDITPELAREGLELTLALIAELCGGARVGGAADAYPRPRGSYKIGVSLAEANRVLGTSLREADVKGILSRLDFPFEEVSPREKILELAPALAGVPYRFAASITYDAPRAFDCSSLTAYLYAQAGVALPRRAVDQYAYGVPVAEPEPGDLVFSNTGSGTIHYESVEFLPGRIKIPEGVDHVGVVLEGGNVLHATRGKGETVVEEMAASEQFKNIVGYRRLIPSDDTRFVVTVPQERLDLMAARSFLVSGIPEDLIEEIGRLYGLEDLEGAKPSPAKEAPANDENFIKANKVRAGLVAEGYSEVMTYAFRNKGAIELKNPLSSDRRFLRENLKDGLTEALAQNTRNAPLLGLKEVKLFEIGTVFGEEKEEIKVGMAGGKKVEEYSLGEAYEKFGKDAPELPVLSSGIRYAPISAYPFVLRDIALWVPSGTSAGEVESIIRAASGGASAAAELMRADLFDEFMKGDRKSLAFHLVFQSDTHTLTDAEVNKVMEKITVDLAGKGFEIR